MQKKIDNITLGKEWWAPSAKNTNLYNYAKAVERKLQMASHNCKEEGRFSLPWANERIRYHVAWL